MVEDSGGEGRLKGRGKGRHGGDLECECVKDDGKEVLEMAGGATTLLLLISFYTTTLLYVDK